MFVRINTEDTHTKMCSFYFLLVKIISPEQSTILATLKESRVHRVRTLEERRSQLSGASVDGLLLIHRL